MTDKKAAYEKWKKKNKKKRWAKNRYGDVTNSAKIKFLEESAERMRDSMTLPEKGMVNILTELGLTFQSQLIISSFIYDFYVPEFNLIIEVDGDYYHGNPAKYARHELNAMQKKNRRRDRTKTKLATQSNYDLLRFWETDINASPDIVRDTIHKFLNEKHGH